MERTGHGAGTAFVRRIPEDRLGPTYLSAMLEAHGRRCNIHLEPLEENGPSRATVALGPDVLPVSCPTAEYHRAVRAAGDVRERTGWPVVLGGTHPICVPEASICADVVSRGEDATPLLELAEAVDAGADVTRIPDLRWPPPTSSNSPNYMFHRDTPRAPRWNPGQRVAGPWRTRDFAWPSCAGIFQSHDPYM